MGARKGRSLGSLRLVKLSEGLIRFDGVTWQSPKAPLIISRKTIKSVIRRLFLRAPKDTHSWSAPYIPDWYRNAQALPERQVVECARCGYTKYKDTPLYAPEAADCNMMVARSVMDA
jgi:hypothetical protein